MQIVTQRWPRPLSTCAARWPSDEYAPPSRLYLASVNTVRADYHVSRKQCLHDRMWSDAPSAGVWTNKTQHDGRQVKQWETLAAPQKRGRGKVWLFCKGVVGSVDAEGLRVELACAEVWMLAWNFWSGCVRTQKATFREKCLSEPMWESRDISQQASGRGAQIKKNWFPQRNYVIVWTCLTRTIACCVRHVYKSNSDSIFSDIFPEIESENSSLVYLTYDAISARHQLIRETTSTITSSSKINIENLGKELVSLAHMRIELS